MDDLYSDDLYTFFLDSSASIFVPVSFPGPLFCPPISVIFCYLAVCFPFQLLRSLSCCVGICLVPLPPSHFWFLSQRGSGSRNAVSSCARLLPRRQLTDANLVIGCLSLLHFPWPRALFTPLPLFSLSLCLSAADLWDQPSKTDSYFFTDHECVSGYATRERERGRGKGERMNM